MPFLAFEGSCTYEKSMGEIFIIRERRIVGSRDSALPDGEFPPRSTVPYMI
jgi:hypothetical protein